MCPQSEPDQAVPVVERSFPERGVEAAESAWTGPHVVDQQVEPTVLFVGDPREHVVDGLVVAVIARHRVSATAARGVRQ